MSNHVHKYVRKKVGSKGFEVYKCSIPGCTHFVQSVFLPGRKSICWRCNTVFTIDEKTALLKKPHCNDCTRFKKPREKNVEKVLNDFVNILGLGETK